LTVLQQIITDFYGDVSFCQQVTTRFHATFLGTAWPSKKNEWIM